MKHLPSKANYSIAEAADYYNVQQATIRRWIAEGHLPATRIGRRIIRISRADLETLGRPVVTGRRSA